MNVIVDRIPLLTDAELANFRDNAERLSKSGTEKQNTAAAAVLPAVTAEIEARKAQRKEALAAARAQRGKARTRTDPAGG